MPRFQHRCRRPEDLISIGDLVMQHPWGPGGHGARSRKYPSSNEHFTIRRETALIESDLVLVRHSGLRSRSFTITSKRSSSKRFRPGYIYVGVLDDKPVFPPRSWDWFQTVLSSSCCIAALLRYLIQQCRLRPWNAFPACVGDLDDRTSSVPFANFADRDPPTTQSSS